jgi:hypothetical protein
MAMVSNWFSLHPMVVTATLMPMHDDIYLGDFTNNGVFSQELNQHLGAWLSDSFGFLDDVLAFGHCKRLAFVVGLI